MRDNKMIPWVDAQDILEEGDILLFRGKGIISFLLKRYTRGIHSHVAVAHNDGGDWQCVEFREFMGGRTVSLANQVKLLPEEIDIFRPIKKIDFDILNVDDKCDIFTESSQKEYTKTVGGAVTRDIINWTGQPYGWSNIFKMFLRYVPGVRLFQRIGNDDDVAEAKVCSTAVTVSLRKNYLDPVPYLADDRVSPADLARSPLIQYLFTIDGR